MEAKQLYKQKYEAQMHEWTAKLELMKAQSEKLTAQARLDVQPHLDAMQAQLGSARTAWTELVAVSDDKWEEAVQKIDHKWTDVKAAVSGAYLAMKPEKKA